MCCVGLDFQPTRMLNWNSFIYNLHCMEKHNTTGLEWIEHLSLSMHLLVSNWKSQKVRSGRIIGDFHSPIYSRKKESSHKTHINLILNNYYRLHFFFISYYRLHD